MAHLSAAKVTCVITMAVNSLLARSPALCVLLFTRPTLAALTSGGATPALRPPLRSSSVTMTGELWPYLRLEQQRLAMLEQQRLAMLIAAATGSAVVRSGRSITIAPARHSRVAMTELAADLSVESCEPEVAWCTTTNGVKIYDDVVGTGDEPAAGQVVYVHYTGTLLSTGAEFASTKGRSPYAFKVGSTAGWDDGVLGMRVGGKRRVLFPPSSAFAPVSSKGIPDASTLRFEVELVSIVPDGPLSGIAGFAGTSGLGPGNLAALVIIALSFIPYFLPEEMRPSFWK